MIVVSDTSPIRALAHLDNLSLLGQLFAEVLIPPAVEHELRKPRRRGMAVDPQEIPNARIESPSDQNQVAQLRAALDLGESEALVLALETKADAILIDERAGRRKATQLGLTAIGTVGILVQAKAEGLLDEVRPCLDRLENELKFFISAKLRADALRDAGE